MTLPRGVLIKGLVVDKDEKPLKGARVMYGGGMASNKMDPQLTNEKGHFVYAAKEGAMVTLTITASGHAPELETFKMDDQTHEMTVYMAESQPMFGRIVGPNDEPIPFAWVYPDTWRGSRSLETRIQADKEGKFMWKDAPYDEVKCDIDGTSEGYVREERKLVVSDKEIVITLRKALRVSGTVVDRETGKAIDQFQVIRGVMWDERNVQWERIRNQKPSTAGKFSYTEGWSRPGYGVRIEAPGYLPEERSGFKLDDKEVAFDFEDYNKVQLLGWGKLNGTLRLNDKLAANEKISIRPKSNQQVRGMPMVQRSIEVMTDATGKFSFDRIPEGLIAVSRRNDIPLGNGAFRSNNTLTETFAIIGGETTTVTLVGEVP